ncbi:MAG: hypothetical protein L6407_08090 [Candidatus Delongbacteria bacterium]|nr:hypothetical protein [Candidatus Delongbacteria bacterium]
MKQFILILIIFSTVFSFAPETVKAEADSVELEIYDNEADSVEFEADSVELESYINEADSVELETDSIEFKPDSIEFKTDSVELESYINETDSVELETDSVEFESYDNEIEESLIIKNKLVSAASLSVLLNHERESEKTKREFDTPSFSYQFEIQPKKSLKFYCNADCGINLNRLTVDGEAPENMDSYEINSNINLAPELKMNASRTYFLKLGLPFYYNHTSPQKENTAVVDTTSLNFSSSFGFDSRESDIHAFSPWDEFERGLLAEFNYTTGIFYSANSQDFDDLTNRIYFLLSLSKFSERYNLMLKPYISFEIELNDRIVDPIWFTAGVFSAWDYKMDINLNGYMKIKYGQFDVDNDTDLWGTETFYQAGIGANYYIFKEFDLFTEINFNKLLFADKDPVTVDGNGVQEDDLEISIKFGLKYLIDFRK